VGEEKPQPLEGIRVLEYGVFHAGPGGAAILGDLGARVVKIETPAGDPIRFWTDIAGLDLALPNGEGVVFEAANRNKRGICLDIERPEGREIFSRLAAGADVFLTNLRKTTKAALGLDYSAIRRLNPRIVHASVSGYGPEGPMADAGAFDPLGQACSGMMFVTGRDEPALIHLGVLDQAAAIAVSHAVLTALFHRERTGAGQEVHVSLYSTALWLQYVNLMATRLLSIDPCVTSDRSRHSPLRNRFQCKDGRWLLSAHHPDEKYWDRFCRAIGRSDLLTDGRYTDGAGRPCRFEELNRLLDGVFAQRALDEWLQELTAAGLMFSPIRHIREVPTDPQAIGNRYVVPFHHPLFGEVQIPGYPFHFSACSAGTRSAAPRLGEHTDEVLQEIGYGDAEIGRLRAQGVIA
jgi:crotonobetainyl-CoA:carnitine CoA-transferase CaiB-like acyl-CoA transferase